MIIREVHILQFKKNREEKRNIKAFTNRDRAKSFERTLDELMDNFQKTCGKWHTCEESAKEEFIWNENEHEPDTYGLLHRSILLIDRDFDKDEADKGYYTVETMEIEE